MSTQLSQRLTDSSQGLSWGVIQTLAATYAAEVVPSVIRAAILSNVNMCWLIGQLMGTGILRALIKNTSDWSYRLPFALQWAWAVPLLFVIYFAPESPCKTLPTRSIYLDLYLFGTSRVVNPT
jgi:SP family general alpha glucoside:H+ symporter-like MFS transporter